MAGGRAAVYIIQYNPRLGSAIYPSGTVCCGEKVEGLQSATLIRPDRRGNPYVDYVVTWVCGEQAIDVAAETRYLHGNSSDA